MLLSFNLLVLVLIEVFFLLVHRVMDIYLSLILCTCEVIFEKNLLDFLLGDLLRGFCLHLKSLETRIGIVFENFFQSVLDN